MWHYENLTDRELTNIGSSRFGEVLLPIEEIGRDEYVKALRAYDKYLELKAAGQLFKPEKINSIPYFRRSTW
ncbi:MAG: hypothetical protein HQL10_13790 [Nitrospirae bacterium]|nr:hypothetical protein [Nitrospirota bacterium]